MLGITSKNVMTPCVGQCKLDEDDNCTGCYRSASEISGWMHKSEDEQIAIFIRCKKKMAQN